MRIVFMGSAELACPCLDRLLTGVSDSVVGVVTQPDRPKGRSLQTAPCPVRALAAVRGIPILTPENVNAPESVQAIRALTPDLIVVVAYGQILKPGILEIPLKGCINVHASLLPKHRGAAPIQWAIARGEAQTGVTTMFLNEGMDTGDIIDQAVEPIREDDTAGTLHDRLAMLGADLLARTVESLRQGTVRRTPQNPVEATYAPKLKKSDGCLDWSRPAVELHNRIHGFNPWPGCYLEIHQPKPLSVKVLKARVVAGQGKPGEILSNQGDGPVIQAGDQALRLLELQPEGRKAMPGAAFLCGHPLKVGDRLG
ncbi:MAG: methionyl-tRNA formyltransferase [Verrucomicrobia bacterium]|nr:methionyl-tRNA formyltransferase [Verrucomicrobiota bacterium]MCG2680532.1 methionyl-tRNA formyltransferase [Kiritimatiellia bacterium]MBU4247922.1 methionyl-tRNA formyltransferase [Verrucomicrobiota bacterium]MBU4289521.1 methionyl-tRNA formyltransferase [Verrucomicrobiota bacterium]MBU4428385.1 methionyl-tRNA formyltransferase [Verrucomicrobiota bacterium]